MDEAALSIWRLFLTVRVDPVFVKSVHTIRLVEDIAAGLALAVALRAEILAGGEALFQTQLVFAIVVDADHDGHNHAQDQESY